MNKDSRLSFFLNNSNLFFAIDIYPDETKLMKFSWGEDDLLQSIIQLVLKQLLPLVCLIGILNNTLNIYIFARSDLKIVIYKCLLFFSTIELMFVSLSFVYFFGKYGYASNFYSIYSYNFRFVELYIMLTLSPILVSLMMLTNIVTAYKRLTLVSIRHRIRVNAYLVVSVLISLAIALNICIPFGFSIVKISSAHISNRRPALNGTADYYLIERSDYSRSIWFKIHLIISAAARGLIFPICFYALNIYVSMKLRRHARRKSELVSRPINRESNIHILKDHLYVKYSI